MFTSSVELILAKYKRMEEQMKKEQDEAKKKHDELMEKWKVAASPYYAYSTASYILTTSSGTGTTYTPPTFSGIDAAINPSVMILPQHFDSEILTFAITDIFPLQSMHKQVDSEAFQKANRAKLAHRFAEMLVEQGIIQIEADVDPAMDRINVRATLRVVKLKE